VSYCPKKVLELSDEFNAKGYHLPTVRAAEQCVHCRLCEMLCPEFAIFVTLRDGEDTALETAVTFQEGARFAG
jgi:2-oxoglutarate ferredoxin oxidoreductase subunit delta